MGVKLCAESHFEHVAIEHEGGSMTLRIREYNPNVKLFVGGATSPDKVTEIFTIVVQVTHVSEILADTDISFFMFFHDSDTDPKFDPTKYSLNTYKGKLSDFIYSIQNK